MITGGQAVRPKREATFIEFDSPARNREDSLWRRDMVGTRRFVDRDLPPSVRERSIVGAYMAYRTNPLAHRLIEMQTSFVLGNGISVVSENEEVLAAIKLWWGNDYNNWPKRLPQRLRDLYLYGEWIHHPLESVADGTTYIRDIQPDAIKDLIQDVSNHSIVDQVVFKSQLEEGGNEIRNKAVWTIRRRLDMPTMSLGPYTGDVFYFGIGRSTDTRRGVGILYPVLDYLELHDEMLFSRAEKVRLASSVWFDLKVEGKTQQQIREMLRKETNIPPAPGTVYAHNEAAELSVKTAELAADDHAQDMEVMKSYITSTQGWPGTWFDDPRGAGRAVGAEMAESAVRSTINLQAEVSELLRVEIVHMLMTRKAAGKLDLSDEDIFDRDLFSLTFNKPTARDIQRVGPALARLSQFVETGLKNKLLSQEEGRLIYVSQIEQLSLSDMPISMDLPVDLRRAAIQPMNPNNPNDVERARADTEIAEAVRQRVALAA